MVDGSVDYTFDLVVKCGAELYIKQLVKKEPKAKKVVYSVMVTV
ncbi:hypothetical protein MACH16_01630 [Marinomonas pontica]|uniref:Uncharacterized protein n=1 Tax=Marinomonas pontica TaxID=264739 RepID=A0ABM8F8Y7_9GAMM|nr:hypothetical protein MACH16_01630 [Marinomonas pontica]